VRLEGLGKLRNLMTSLGLLIGLKKESMELCLHSPTWYLIKYNGNMDLYFIRRIGRPFSCFYVVTMQEPLASVGKKILYKTQDSINYKDLLQSKQVTSLTRLMVPSIILFVAASTRG
jgi:hypothetical protein